MNSVTQPNPSGTSTSYILDVTRAEFDVLQEAMTCANSRQRTFLSFPRLISHALNEASRQILDASFEPALDRLEALKLRSPTGISNDVFARIRFRLSGISLERFQTLTAKLAESRDADKSTLDTVLYLAMSYAPTTFMHEDGPT